MGEGEDDDLKSRLGGGGLSALKEGHSGRRMDTRVCGKFPALPSSCDHHVTWPTMVSHVTIM